MLPAHEPTHGRTEVPLSPQQARILVVSSDPAVVQLITDVVAPLGHLLMQAQTVDELALRLSDVRPELLLIDGDAPLARPVRALAEVLGRVRGDGTRPQVLVLSRVDDTLREALCLACRADEVLDKPTSALELQVCVRTAVRVHRSSAQAMRDRDILNALFELSTFTTSFTSNEEVLAALARRVSEWMGMPHVVVTLGPASQPRAVAEVHREDGVGRGTSFVDRRHAELSLRGQMLVIEASEGVLAGEHPATIPYVGLPLQSQDGEILGALHAWGQDAGVPTTQRIGASGRLRVLRVAAERISTEIQLHQTNRRLEEMAEARTADLTAALERLRGVNVQLLEASLDTVMRLARAAEYRDGDTGEHVERMSSYAQVLARQLGMTVEDQALIKLAAPMHDVGKIGIRDSVLLKEGRLNEDEWQQMREHPNIGAQILGGSRSKLLQMAEQIALAHHEKWDGTGYPNATRGEEIPLVGRIVALADVFDALTTPRVYKDAWSVDEAVAHIQRERGKHFDPRIVAAFEQCLEEMLEVRATFVH